MRRRFQPFQLQEKLPTILKRCHVELIWRRWKQHNLYSSTTFQKLFQLWVIFRQKRTWIKTIHKRCAECINSPFFSFHSINCLQKAKSKISQRVLVDISSFYLHMKTFAYSCFIRACQNVPLKMPLSTKWTFLQLC